ncbi:helix-turn-helix domain-containing protein [uncultured Tateyamaria sp.]|uniref:helix-turn-helix domain-containing protein n=1 Tax=uncultured Tateyamaria sp. TaxID=455651 RepID=UPI00262C9090|nr:helix-turn-helix domain-containing protein [uncultured Tateyamaria sp.]
MEQRRLTRLLDRAAKQFAEVEAPRKGWIAGMRQALGMSAEYVAQRKGVSRNAVYQAERSEQEGAVSLKQMEQLASAMGGTFVYAIVPNGRIDDMKYKHARAKAVEMLHHIEDAASWSKDDRHDWIDDKAAELLHDMPSDFWESAD